MAVPDSSPRASAEVCVRNPQRLTPTDGTFFLPGPYVVPWGHASAPTGVAPEALQERGCSCKVFSQSLSVCEVLISAGLGGAARIDGSLRSVYARKCSRASSPRAWARSRRSGGALRLVHTPLRRPSAGQRVRCPRLPSSGSRIVGSSLSCYRVIQVDARALFDKGRLVVRRHVHESSHAGVLGRARSRSLGIPRLAALVGS
jgi:hypothetical protein